MEGFSNLGWQAQSRRGAHSGLCVWEHSKRVELPCRQSLTQSTLARKSFTPSARLPSVNRVTIASSKILKTITKCKNQFRRAGFPFPSFLPALVRLDIAGNRECEASALTRREKQISIIATTTNLSIDLCIRHLFLMYTCFVCANVGADWWAVLWFCHKI